MGYAVKLQKGGKTYQYRAISRYYNNATSSGSYFGGYQTDYGWFGAVDYATAYYGWIPSNYNVSGTTTVDYKVNHIIGAISYALSASSSRSNIYVGLKMSYSTDGTNFEYITDLPYQIDCSEPFYSSISGAAFPFRTFIIKPIIARYLCAELYYINIGLSTAWGSRFKVHEIIA